MLVPIAIFAMLLLAFLFRRPLAERFPASHTFEVLAPWLLGIVLVVFLAFLFRGIILEYFR